MTPGNVIVVDWSCYFLKIRPPFYPTWAEDKYIVTEYGNIELVVCYSYWEI